jgi:hypothetical protein
VGHIGPTLKCLEHGKIIKRRHHFTVDENWQKIRLKNIETVNEKFIARLVSNVCRRYVSAEEKSEMLEGLGEVYFSEGVEPGKIVYEMAEGKAMSYRWVMDYLFYKIKERPSLVYHSKNKGFDKCKEKTSKSKVARLATEDDMLQICKKKS